MDKLCKRCQFRTPQTRAICQVCGHKEFCQSSASATINNNVRLAEAGPASDATGENIFGKAKSLFGSSAAEWKELGQKIASATQKILRLAVPSTAELSPESAQSAEILLIEPTTDRKWKVLTQLEQTRASLAQDESTQPQSLDELMNWFKTYGTERGIVFEKSRTDADNQPSGEVQKAA